MQFTQMQNNENEFLFDGNQIALLEKEMNKDGYVEFSNQKSEKTLQMETRDLSVFYGQVLGIEKISLPIYSHSVTALIGPSGCGKTTFLRALNRMHELTKKAKVTGKIFLNGEIINNSHQDPIIIRRKIGMVFQKPNPFPTMSIYDNVASGLRLVGYRKKSYLDQVVKDALMQAALWDEVKDRLKDNAGNLSGGQQQRLCIARALAVDPEVILMDEPTSSLDPKSTIKIEELITRLKKDVTIIMVTHNMHQAMRISDYTAFFYVGKLMEYGSTQKIFNRPSKERTQEYVSGRFS